MRRGTLGAWDSDSDEGPLEQPDAQVRLDPAAARLERMRLVGLVPGGNSDVGQDRKGLLLLTVDYGYHVPAIANARRVLNSMHALGRELVHEVDLTQDPKDEAARYNPTGTLMFPTFFVRGDDGLYEYQGRAEAVALMEAVRVALPSRVDLGWTRRPAAVASEQLRSKLVPLGMTKTRAPLA